MWVNAASFPQQPVADPGMPFPQLRNMGCHEVHCCCPIFWIVSQTWSSVDSSRWLFSLKCALPSWQDRHLLEPWSVFSFFQATKLEASPGGLHRAIAFDLWRVEMLVLDGGHLHCLPPSGAGGFLSAAGCCPGPDWYCFSTPPPLLLQASLLTAFYSWLQLSLMRWVLFLHITAKPRPCMLSLRTASPDLTQSVRAEGKPHILPDHGGQIKKRLWYNDSQMHEMFGSLDCQNFSFLFPICSDDTFPFCDFFFFKKR